MHTFCKQNLLACSSQHLKRTRVGPVTSQNLPFAQTSIKSKHAARKNKPLNVQAARVQAKQLRLLLFKIKNTHTSFYSLDIFSMPNPHDRSVKGMSGGVKLNRRLRKVSLVLHGSQKLTKPNLSNQALAFHCTRIQCTPKIPTHTRTASLPSLSLHPLEHSAYSKLVSKSCSTQQR